MISPWFLKQESILSLFFLHRLVFFRLLNLKTTVLQENIFIKRRGSSCNRGLLLTGNYVETYEKNKTRLSFIKIHKPIKPSS